MYSHYVVEIWQGTQHSDLKKKIWTIELKKKKRESQREEIIWGNNRRKEEKKEERRKRKENGLNGLK
jgi:hypothetical protein